MARKGQGKWAQGAVGKWKKGAVGKWKKGAKGPWDKAREDENRIRSSIETGTTGFAKQYSKSPYRTSDFPMGGGRAEFGVGKPKAPKAKAIRVAPKQGRRKGRKAK